MAWCLFLPFSALDKIFGFEHAVEQAQSMFKPRPIAIAMILIGLFVEVVLHARGRHWHRRSGVCLRHRRLLRGDGGSLQAIPGAGRFLVRSRRQRTARIVRGLRASC
jgi:hypothetical protein